MKKSVSILGLGWFGLALGETLSQHGYLVKGSTTTEEKIEEIKKNGILPFLFKLPGNEPEVDFFNCDSLVITLPPSTPDYRDAIGKVITLLAKYGVHKVIFISSTSVYSNDNHVVNEQDAKYISSSHSGVKLLEIEDLFRENDQLDATIVRFAGLYGPKRNPARFLAGKTDLSGGKSPVNLIHQDDCVGIVKLLLDKEIFGDTFNACAPHHPTREEFYTKACLKLNLEPPQFNDEEQDYKIVDSSKLIEAMSYQYLHPDPMNDL